MPQSEPEIDVAALLLAVRAAVRAQTPPAVASPHADALSQALDQVELTRVISAHWPITGQTVPQKIVALAQKIARRLLRWYINPIVEQQNAYNAAVAQTLRQLAEAYADLARAQTAGEPPPTPYGRSTLRPDESPSDGHSAPGPDDQPPTPYGRSTLRPDRQQDLSATNSGMATSVLQALVAARGAFEPPTALPDIALRALAPQRRLRARVSAHWPLPASTPVERGAALVHKIQRQLLRFYVNLIVEKQNAANAALEDALQALTALDGELRARAAAQRAARR